MIVYVRGRVYVYLAIRVNTFGSINVFLWQGMDFFFFLEKRYFSTGDNPRLFILVNSCVKTKEA